MKILTKLMNKIWHSNADKQSSGFVDKQGNMRTQAELEQWINVESKQWLKGFGYEINWYMLKEAELVAKDISLDGLANAINIQQQQPMSWNDGVSHAYDFSLQDRRCRVFITPAVDGWIYIISSESEHLDLLEDVLPTVDLDYYAFGSYRVCGAVAWRQVKSGNTIRYFSYADGVVYHNEGEQTVEEAKLNLLNLSGLDNEQAVDTMFAEEEKIDSNTHANTTATINFPDEEDVMRLCAAWTGEDINKFDDYPSSIISEQGIAGYL
ncbi:hypothetical protein [Psychrobacter sp. I-STPA6b]|uniref:hypothetical protein n=1 Tax=Psychrobacter sp. I-STPA6b TaxID=2585718 RepID=UPI001D0C5944|nr:hypothetical protein [Psychrobacter sp. I-STPA6b]